MKDRLYLVAASAVGIAGGIHLYLGLSLLKSQFFQFSDFFLIVAAVQLCWTIPMLKKFGRMWLFVGIGGNLALFGLWVLTRLPNPITRIGLPVNSLGIAEEAFQLAYIAIAIALVYALKPGRSFQKKETLQGSA
ncbi:MAG TPA: hypothetical protein VJ792_09165 [Candidatus Nitrosotalea sp.]|nr:hypothetical protein [Candidatus Nitrosotalea sp.]